MYIYNYFLRFIYKIFLSNQEHIVLYIYFKKYLHKPYISWTYIALIHKLQCN